MALSVRIDWTWLYNVRHHGEIDLVFYEYLGKDGTSGNDLNLVTSEVAKVFSVSFTSISRLFLIEMKQVTHSLVKGRLHSPQFYLQRTCNCLLTEIYPRTTRTDLGLGVVQVIRHVFNSGKWVYMENLALYKMYHHLRDILKQFYLRK